MTRQSRLHFQMFDLHTMTELRRRHPAARRRSVRAMWWLPVVHMLMLINMMVTLGCFLATAFTDQLFWLDAAVSSFFLVWGCLLALPWLLASARRLEKERALITQPIPRRRFAPAQTRYLFAGTLEVTEGQQRDDDLRR